MKRGGNTTLITGGASGIGLALARRLTASGDTVIVCGRTERALREAERGVPGVRGFRADITDANDRAALLERVRSEYPNLNVLINNAGSVSVADLTNDGFLEILRAETEINLLAPLALASGLLPLLRENRGTIVNVTSAYAFVASTRTAPYSAAKTALHVMTQALRRQLSGSGVDVVEVMPPAVDTAMSSHYRGNKISPDEAARAIVRGLHSGRPEVVIGASHILRVLSRIAPRFAFDLVAKTEGS